MKLDMREMKAEDVRIIGMVNREETIEEEYVGAAVPGGMGLTLERAKRRPPLEVERWDEDEVQHRIGLWRPEIEKGGFFLGAFEGERLVGFVIVGHRHSDNSAEMSAIFVDRDYRRGGVGSSLMRASEEKAKACGLGALYIYSVATAPAVDFYLTCGYHVISIIDKSLVKHLPWDVVLAKKL